MHILTLRLPVCFVMSTKDNAVDEKSPKVSNKDLNLNLNSKDKLDSLNSQPSSTP